QLNSGQSQQSVAASFWLSPEHRGLQVDSYYLRYLKRPSDTAGRQFWVNRFVNDGLSESQVQLGFLTSQEYNTTNASDTAFVTALYRDVLGRAPDTAGQNFWVQQLQQGSSRQDVATAFLTSAENFNLVVESDYVNLLHRASDASGKQFWV